MRNECGDTRETTWLHAPEEQGRHRWTKGTGMFTTVLLLVSLALRLLVSLALRLPVSFAIRLMAPRVVGLFLLRNQKISQLQNTIS